MTTLTSSLPEARCQGDLRASALAAAAAERYAKAIDLATRYLTHADDMELECHLVEWRCKAFAELPAASPRPDWPPVYADPFPGTKGLPEINRAQLSTAIMAGAILHHGSLLVRGLIDPDVAASYVAGIEQAFTDHGRHNGGYDENLATPRYRRLPLPDNNLVSASREFVEGSSGLYLTDSPRTTAEFIALLHGLDIIPLIESYMGERPALSAGKTTLRRVLHTTSTTSWHQDGAFLGEEIRSINLWVCLSDAGVDASGLDIVPRRLDYLAERGTGNAYFNWDVGDDIARAAAGSIPIASPVFHPGDAMLFDHMMLHRTGLPPNMTRDRYAIEAWMFAPSRYPMEHMPLVL
ncbi:MAG TPA: phytanoyl-CoA dioxygenase family protein [Pseudoxanthomonas sp.]